MDIRVSGHQIDTGSALQEHASERLNGISEKYFSRAISSQVTFNKAPANASRGHANPDGHGALAAVRARVIRDDRAALDRT